MFILAVLSVGAPERSGGVNDDADLVRKAKEGDMNAFETLIKRYQQPIYALCRRMTGAHQSADDLAQETFIKAYFSLARIDEKRPLYPWLRRIAVNSALNLIESRKREVPFDPAKLDFAAAGRTDGNAPHGGSGFSGLPHQKQASPEESLENSRFEEKFQEALASLPPDQRSVFILRFYEGQSYEEMALSLGVNVGTVMSRLNRARKKLKDRLGDVLVRRG